MKPIYWFTALVVFLLLSPSLAQAADTDITDVRVTPALDLDQMKFILSHQREEIFQRGMALESKQWKVFWNVYDEFDKEKGQLDAKRLLLLGTFVKQERDADRRGGHEVDQGVGREPAAGSRVAPKVFRDSEYTIESGCRSPVCSIG